MTQAPGRKPRRSRAKASPPAHITGLRFDAERGIAFCSVYVPGGKGVIRRRSRIPAKSYDDAVDKFAKFKAVVLQRTVRRAEMTFAEFIALYFDDIRAQVQPRTATDYKLVIDRYLLPCFGAMALSEISTADVRAFEVALRQQHLADATVHNYVNVLLLLLHRAVDDFDVLDTFPLKKRLKRKKPIGPSRELSDDERHRFLAVFDDLDGFRADLATRRKVGPTRPSPFYAHVRRFGGGTRPEGETAEEQFRRIQYLRPFFVVAFETGLRRGDLLRLAWRDVDLDGGMISIVMAKTKLRVTIPISAACRAALTTRREARPTAHLVFTDEGGAPLSLTRLRRAFIYARRAAKLDPKFRLHDVRHTYASRLASLNVPIQTISRLLGHTTLGMTARYARASDDATRIAVRVLDEHP